MVYLDYMMLDLMCSRDKLLCPIEMKYLVSCFLDIQRNDSQPPAVLCPKCCLTFVQAGAHSDHQTHPPVSGLPGAPCDNFFSFLI